MATIMDITIEDHGTVVSFYGDTDEGSDWLVENVETEPWQHLGPALVVDHRSAQYIIAGAREYGLAVGLR
jgi:hypothetical protein